MFWFVTGFAAGILAAVVYPKPALAFHDWVRAQVARLKGGANG